MRQIFILSPAKTSGERAKFLYNSRARFGLAQRLQAEQPVPLAEVFTFLSGLYFRGKVTYARAFAQPPKGIPGTLVVTTNRGLLPVDVPVTLAELTAFAEGSVDPKDSRYAGPIRRDAELLGRVIGPRCRVIFLGSIGTKRYVEVLLESFGQRLLFPPAFVGRGDMSRGGLLLRAEAAGQELEYAPLVGATRHGKRPQKLAPRSWGYRLFE
jgi:hypothetical protein